MAAASPNGNDGNCHQQLRELLTMDLHTLSLIAELVGTVAVVITLAYLAVQVRQNAKSIDQQNRVTSASIQQARADSMIALSQLISSPENLPVFMKLTSSKTVDPDVFDNTEKARVMSLLTALRANLENTYLQYEQGFLPAEFYEAVGVANIANIGPAILAFNLPLTPRFRAEVQRILER